MAPGLLIDLDGTVYQDGQPVPGAAERAGVEPDGVLDSLADLGELS